MLSRHQMSIRSTSICSRRAKKDLISAHSKYLLLREKSCETVRLGDVTGISVFDAFFMVTCLFYGIIRCKNICLKLEKTREKIDEFAKNNFFFSQANGNILWLLRATRSLRFVIELWR